MKDLHEKLKRDMEIMLEVISNVVLTIHHSDYNQQHKDGFLKDASENIYNLFESVLYLSIAIAVESENKNLFRNLSGIKDNVNCNKILEHIINGMNLDVK